MAEVVTRLDDDEDPERRRKTSDRKRDYEVGYGKPPKKHQWKKGQSGNSAGRPKKAKEEIKPTAGDLTEILVQELLKPITTTKDGVPTEITVLDALAMQLVQLLLTTKDGRLKLKVLDHLEKLRVLDLLRQNIPGPDKRSPIWTDDLERRFIEIEAEILREEFLEEDERPTNEDNYQGDGSSQTG